MDIKKLLGDSPLSEDERLRVAENEALVRRAATLTGAPASLNPREASGQTVSGLLKISDLHAMGAFQDQEGANGHGHASAAKTASEHFEAMAKNDPFSPSALARLQNGGLLASAYDHLSFGKSERERKERQFADPSAFIAKQHHQMERHAAEVRKREDEKLEYARRSAEASEAALAAERQRTAAAVADAAESKKEARRDRRNMRISLWIAGASLLVAAWQSLNDHF